MGSGEHTLRLRRNTCHFLLHSQLTRMGAMEDRRTSHDIEEGKGWVHDLAHLPMFIAFDGEETVACDHGQDLAHECRLWSVRKE